MPANMNPRIVELLSWHGHAQGGVHVPFQAASNPLGYVVELHLPTLNNPGPAELYLTADGVESNRVSLIIEQ